MALASPGWAGHYVGNWSVSTPDTSVAAPITIEATPGVLGPVLDGDHGNTRGCTTTACDGPILTIGSGVIIDLQGIIFQDGYNVAGPTVTPAPGPGGGSGGAIENDFGGTVSVSASTFDNNVATNGGAIDNADNGAGTLNVVGSGFFGNHAAANPDDPSDGGAIDNGDDGGNGTASVSGSTFVANVAGFGNAAISPTIFVINDGGAIDNADLGVPAPWSCRTPRSLATRHLPCRWTVLPQRLATSIATPPVVAPSTAVTTAATAR